MTPDLVKGTGDEVINLHYYETFNYSFFLDFIEISNQKITNSPTPKNFN
ncbi:hypothetical protein [Okeania sp. SIO1I7]|nr:hypothetical protein [Okeania sp. SIO1I7]NET28027.1 hypothetical protein [Okeania sp. SIO1I7]